MTDNKYEGFEVASSRTPAAPEPGQPASEPREENAVVPYQPGEPETEQPAANDNEPMPTDLNDLVTYLQQQNAELKSQIDDRNAFTESLRDAVHNAPVKPPIDPRNCSTADYIANKDEIRKSLGIRSR